MTPIRKLVVAGLCIWLAAPAAVSAGEFSFKFEWGNIPPCDTGNPNIVKNPIFTLSGVPSGTAEIGFKMVDTYVPSYNHGGGKVPYTGNNTIPQGVFEYNSPCPPDGTHIYRWTATAKDKNGGTLGTATSEREFPQD